MKLLGATFATVCAASLLAAAAAPAFDGPDGRLTQINGGPQVSRGCLSDDGASQAGSNTCSDGRALANANAVEIIASPDGSQLYVGGDAGIAVLQRDFATGELFQSAGSDGCFDLLGTADGFPCGGPLAGFSATYGIAISPDGANVYATSLTNDAVYAFARNPANGALAPIGGPAVACVAMVPAGPTAGCADGRALDAPRQIAVSPDGTNVYVTSQDSDAVAVFVRGSGGQLIQLTSGPPGSDVCISETGGSEDGAGTCRDGDGLTASAAMPLAVSGASVYVGADDSLLAFNRGNGGSLSESQCLYGGASPPPAPCVAGLALEDISDIAVAPGGAHLYTTSAAQNALGYYARGPAGTISAPGACLGAGGTSCGNVGVAAMTSPAGLAISPDGSSLYVASGVGGAQSKAIASFALDPSSGYPSQLGDTAACIAETPGIPPATASCANGKALAGVSSLLVTADGNYAYSAAITPTDGVAAFVRTDPPETAITRGPGRKTKHRRSLFAYNSDDSGAGFLCKLDKNAFKPCNHASFKTRKLRRGSRHTFQVYAVDGSGQVDETPALRRFKVVRGGKLKELAKRNHKGKRRSGTRPSHRPK